jgi:hypothetical protein
MELIGNIRTVTVLALLLTVVFCQWQANAANELCMIEVVDQDNGWPVPLVELRTTHNCRFVSDNAGIIAFDLPELMGEETWFFVKGHGYSVPKDGFGYRGIRLTPTPGKKLTVTVKRQLPAKRLGRITGGGLFGESQRFGLETAWQDQGILGCDSVQTAVHAGRLYWAWGDTTLARYPLGLFHMLSATTDIQPLHSFEPPVRLRYHYVADRAGKPCNVAKMPGDGPTWISGYISLPDRNHKTHLVGTYVKVKGFLTVYECGLCVWDDETERFQRHRVLWTKTPESPDAPLVPDGHPTFWTDASDKQWVLFGDPFPRLKCAPTFEAWRDPDCWQAIDPQKTVPAVDSGEAITPHRGSIAFNAFRRKWVSVFTQSNGNPSNLGEIWYTEAEHPMGPWGPATKVVTHENYTFYNPRLHPEFTPADSPILLFEATYTKTFSKTEEATPRYDYNQLLYRLDLDDPNVTP